MSSLKHSLLATTCALMGAAGLAATANATPVIYGGGSTLLNPYWVQIADCNDATDNVLTLDRPALPLDQTLSVKPPGMEVPTPSCPGHPGGTAEIIKQGATGSGVGVGGLFAHEAVVGLPFTNNGTGGFKWDTTGTIWFGSSTAAGNEGDQIYPSIQYALSDNSLTYPDYVAYNFGTGVSHAVTFQGAGHSGTFTAPANYSKATFSGSTGHVGGTTNWPIPAALYGPMIQFPVSVDPVALAYDPTNGFNVQAGSASANGGLALDKEAYCRIFLGEITDWNDAKLTSLNAGVSLTGGTPLAIKLVGRLDSSGTTSIFTRHLATVCSTFVTDTVKYPGGVNPYAAGTTTLPAAVAGLFTLAQGSSGVADAIHNNAGAIGYVGADFTIEATANTGANTYNLNVAALKNNAGNFEEPTDVTAVAAFGSILPPQSSSTGAYNAAASSDRRDPTQWVQSTAAGVALANPTASGAYPIVGTTNVVAYTCYANSANLTTAADFLKYVVNKNTEAVTILNNAKLGNMPAAWGTAIQQTFLTNSGGALGALNLWMDQAQAGANSGVNGNTNCGGNQGVVGG